MNNFLAIASCRVSSKEQELNHSLSSQEKDVLSTAKELGVNIPQNYWWSGSVSSKAGTNVGRKDLEEMIAVCRKDKRIKYLIVAEPDRFMRSTKEAMYYEVVFDQMGVKIYYARDPELNVDDGISRFKKFFKYWGAEQSNEERQVKSVNGITNALKEGRWPFRIPCGYMKGSIPTVPEPHPTAGKEMKAILISMIEGTRTPTKALEDFNNADFRRGMAHYKMDKFRQIATNSFYAGTVEVHKQIDYTNQYGLHQPLISRLQHNLLILLFENKAKNQHGPRRDGNPKYPLNNIVECDRCLGFKNNRIVGFDGRNGKPNSKVYEKYRCRACKKYLNRDVLHEAIVQLFKQNQLSPIHTEQLTRTLKKVWDSNKGSNDKEIAKLKSKMVITKRTIQLRAIQAVDPAHINIKEELLESIAIMKTEVAELDDKLILLVANTQFDKNNFLSFAIKTLQDMGDKFLEMNSEQRVRCKQIYFPEGFHWDGYTKVYTPQISPIIRLASNKKDTEVSLNSLMVRVQGL
jgi:DNA invertase Pin-like site-specific DNA recombinase